MKGEAKAVVAARGEAGRAVHGQPREDQFAPREPAKSLLTLRTAAALSLVTR